MINKKYKLLVPALLLFCAPVMAQFSTISQEVLGSTGGTSGTVFPWGSMDYTVGETVVWTYAPGITPLTVKVLTQGFHQPASAGSSLDANVIYSNSTCIGANNGTAAINVLTFTGPVTFSWATLPDTTANVDSLKPGTYVFTVSDGNFTLTDSVTITESQTDCADNLNFYNGITPNGDNNNDYWYIDSVGLIKENKVGIYNRWGDIVWNCENYDNVSEGKVWKGKSNKGQDLPDATYFYVVEANGHVYKGWIELTH